MAKPSVEELEAVESRLNRAFMLALVAVVCSVTAGLVLPPPADRGTAEWAISLGALLFVVGAYVWFAVAIGRAATYLVASPWKYVLWVLAAPFLALLPIPIVSTLIGVSPLSLKFLFAGQLRSEVRERLLAD
jgi:hypothetical protein